MSGKQGYSLVGGVDDLVRLRERRLKKPAVHIEPTFVEPQESKVFKDVHFGFLKAQTEIAEKQYRSRPIENIPDMKPDSYFLDFGDPRKLPRLLTV